MKRLAAALGFALAALQLPSCQFPDYDVLPEDGSGGEGGGAAGGASGGSPTAGSEAAGGTGEPPLCDQGLSCEPITPAGWLGPVAYFQGPSGTELPDCPEGYAEPTDLHADPAGAPAECACTCAAGPQKCGATTKDVKIYGDLNCANECYSAGAQACTAVTGCSGSSVSIHAPITEPTGSCVAEVTATTPEPPGWERDTRFCELDVDVVSCAQERSCFPTPPAPFASQLCVYRVVLAGQRAPACPDEYPSGPELLYSTFEDERDCGECECEGPNGGKCTGEVTYGNGTDCSQSKYLIGSPCETITRPSRLEVRYVMSPGECEVASEPEPIGDVVPSGNYHAVCCR